MLDLALLKDCTNNMLYPMNCGFESTLFMNINYCITKIFNNKVTLCKKKQKERIIKTLYLSETLSSEIFPEALTLIYDDNYNFCGYEMEYLDGKNFIQFFRKNSIENIIFILEQIENYLKYLNENNFYITDFNPLNFIITDFFNVKFIDFDSICYKTSYAKRFVCHIDFHCRFSDRINKQTNIYCFYLLCIHALLKHKKFDQSTDTLKNELLKKKKIPSILKEKLINFLNIDSNYNLKDLQFPFTTY